MPTRPTSPDPSGNTPEASPFAGLNSGLTFFQDWLKAAGSALPHLPSSGANAGMSNWAMPTLDPEEINKRIEDLKTVQFWLEQNTRMVAVSIQGLEVQKMTLNTLKGMNVSMDSLRDALTARHTPPRDSFADAASTDEDAPSTETHTAAKASNATDVDQGASAGPDLVNPMRWWDTLTEQFTHLATQASQTAQTVGSSMSDLLKPGQLGSRAGTGGGRSAATKAATVRKAKSGKTAPRKAATKKASAGSRKEPSAAGKG